MRRLSYRVSKRAAGLWVAIAAALAVPADAVDLSNCDMCHKAGARLRYLKKIRDMERKPKAENEKEEER
jgi:hypothetical protein